jgi:hypothetical protein
VSVPRGFRPTDGLCLMRPPPRARPRAE